MELLSAPRSPHVRVHGYVHKLPFIFSRSPALISGVLAQSSARWRPGRSSAHGTRRGRSCRLGGQQVGARKGSFKGRPGKGMFRNTGAGQAFPSGKEQTRPGEGALRNLPGRPRAETGSPCADSAPPGADGAGPRNALGTPGSREGGREA